MHWIKLSCSHLLRETSESRVTHGIGKGGEAREESCCFQPRHGRGLYLRCSISTKGFEL